MSSQLINLDMEPENKINLLNPQPDQSEFLQILYQNKKYSLRKNNLIDESLYLKNFCQLNSICIEITEQFDITSLQNVLSMLSGTPLQIKRSQIYSYYPIIKYLQLEKLLNKIQDDIYRSFIHYSIFYVIKTAQISSDQDMFAFCLEQLEKEHFEQLLYNRHELLQLDLALFKLIIKAHNRFKSNTGKGLDYREINEILKDYCKINNFTEEMQNQLKFQTIDLTSLSSQEYKTIFLDELEQNIQNAQQQAQNNNNEHVEKLNSIKSQTTCANSFEVNQVLALEKNNSKISTKSKKQLKIQMQINYYKKKIKELEEENKLLLESLDHIKEATLQNQVTHNQIIFQLQRLKNDLENKKKIQLEYLEKIKKYEKMLAKLQKELDERTAEVEKLIKQQEFKESIKNSEMHSIEPANTLFNSNFSVVSQFLPANLIKEMFSSKSISNSSKRLTPIPKRKKVSLSSVSFQSSLQSIIQSQFQSHFNQSKLKFQIQPSSIDELDYSILSSFLETQGYNSIRCLELIYRRSKTKPAIGSSMSIRNKNSLLFLIKTQSGEKIGSFVSTPIPESKIAYLEDKNAFLFTLTKQKKLKIKPNEAKQAIFLSQSYLISFGNDLLIANQCQKQKSFCLWPSSYGDEQFTKGKGPSWLAGSSEFAIDILQIYEVIEQKKQPGVVKNSTTY